MLKKAAGLRELHLRVISLLLFAFKRKVNISKLDLESHPRFQGLSSAAIKAQQAASSTEWFFQHTLLLTLR